MILAYRRDGYSIRLIENKLQKTAYKLGKS